MKRARGMTMIEVLVALLIATVGLVGALAMASSMLAGTTTSRQFTEANALAQWKMEELLLLTTTSAGWGVDGDDYCSSTSATTGQLTCAATVPATDANYYTRHVAWTNNTSDNNKIVTVTVKWPGATPLHGIAITNERNPL